MQREQDLVKERDDRIQTLTREMQQQQREMERYSNETLKAQREQQILKEEGLAEQQRHRETKDLLKKSEEKCT